ncbi:MAG TPA: alternative ribosome rescue aminoacyl-tRNA hydrolase ArfB [Vicinamibacterales bacterium]
MQITTTIVIDDSELEERFVRSSGPGGQNVNKVSTAVQLRFDANGSRSLSADVKQRLRKLAGSRMTTEGVLVIDARARRTQAENREDARARLATLVRQAAIPPKRRTKTKPTRASKERRLSSKRNRSETKRARRSIAGDD